MYFAYLLFFGLNNFVLWTNMPDVTQIGTSIFIIMLNIEK